jgi:hypothetical protein
MYLHTGATAAVATGRLAGDFPLPAHAQPHANTDANAHAVSGVPLPSDALGFPASARQARDVVAGQPLLALSSADAAPGTAAVANCNAGGFEDLPAVLVANLIVACLGSPCLATVRHLATLYPEFCDAIRHAVNADPGFKSLATLLAPMRVIALRDLLWAAPHRPDGSKLTQTQYSQATDALREPRWLPSIEHLVGHKVEGVQPEHNALLAQFDSVLRGDKLDAAAAMVTSQLAKAINLQGKGYSQVMSLIWLRQNGQVVPDLGTDIGLLRKEVLRDAFARIAKAFAAQEGWTVEGLEAYALSPAKA